MNLNLISPTTNGHDYTVRFKEPITIPANSKVRFNFCELTRSGKIVLDEDATITMDVLNVLPQLKSADFTDNTYFSNGTNTDSVTIAKGSYTFKEFQDKLSTALLQLRTKSRFTISTYQPSAHDADPISTSNLNLGYEPNPARIGNFTINTFNSHQAGAVKGTENVAYVSAGAGASYDNYALGQQGFNHFTERALPTYVPGRTPYNRGGVLFERTDLENKYNSYIVARGADTYNDQTGKVFIGLYSRFYGEGIATPAPIPAGSRTTGDQLPKLAGAGANAVPKVFMGIEIDKTAGRFNFLVAEDSNGDPIHEWTTLNKEIGSMRQVASVSGAIMHPGGDNQPLVILECSVDNTELTPIMHYTALAYKETGGWQVIYDSRAHVTGLPYSWFVSPDVTYDEAVAVKSQVPFDAFASATVTDEGFESIAYKFFADTALEGVIQKYSLTFSDELSQAVGVDTQELFPNKVGEQNDTNIKEDLELNWKTDNYSIFCSLPIQNFKNTENKADGGFSKSVLANVPCPFAQNNVIASQNSNDKSAILSVYEPRQTIISDLKNNKIETNNIRIQILNMKNEQLATQVTSSVVNFTIE